MKNLFISFKVYLLELPTCTLYSFIKLSEIRNNIVNFKSIKIKKDEIRKNVKNKSGDNYELQESNSLDKI